MINERAYGKDWLAGCQDNVTEWNIRSWCQRPSLPVGQYYKVAMSVHCDKLVLTLMWLLVLPGCKIPTDQQTWVMVGYAGASIW